MCFLSVCCFAQAAADKLFLEGQKLQQVMTLSSQEKAINKFKSAQIIYKAQDKKAMCDNQIAICKSNIKQLKPDSEPKPASDSKLTSKSHHKQKPQVSPSLTTREVPLYNVANMQYNGGVYTGTIKNGKPHGKGTFVFGTKAIISAYDMNQAKADAGESVEGNFENGVFYRGIYHSVSGDKKLNFGSKGE